MKPNLAPYTQQHTVERSLVSDRGTGKYVKVVSSPITWRQGDFVMLEATYVSVRAVTL